MKNLFLLIKKYNWKEIEIEIQRRWEWVAISSDSDGSDCRRERAAENGGLMIWEGFGTEETVDSRGFWLMWNDQITLVQIPRLLVALLVCHVRFSHAQLEGTHCQILHTSITFGPHNEPNPLEALNVFHTLYWEKVLSSTALYGNTLTNEWNRYMSVSFDPTSTYRTVVSKTFSEFDSRLLRFFYNFLDFSKNKNYCLRISLSTYDWDVMRK